MSDQKILFLDIDDTLLTRDKRLTEENRDAMDRALAAGHKLVVCTGRPHFGICALAEKLHLADPGFYLISYNGGQIYDCGAQKSIYRKSMSLADVRTIFAEADRIGVHMQSYNNETLLVRSYDEETAFYVNHIKCGFREIPELPGGSDEEPVKVLAISLHEPEKLDALRTSAEKLVGDHISVFLSNPYYLEFVPKGISKGFAVRFLCDHLGIPIEHSVAAGDMENDIPMLEAANVGCAMANATEGAKAAADYITERDCDHSGVAEIIERFIL